MLLLTVMVPRGCCFGSTRQALHWLDNLTMLVCLPRSLSGSQVNAILKHICQEPITPILLTPSHLISLTRSALSDGMSAL